MSNLKVGEHRFTFQGTVLRTDTGYRLIYPTGSKRISADDATKLMGGDLSMTIDGIAEAPMSDVPVPQHCQANIPVISGDAAKKLIEGSSSTPVVVKYFAPWCGACQEISSEMVAAARNVCSKAKIVAVNVDEDDGLSDAEGIDSLPAVAVYKNGKRVDMNVGAEPAHKIVAFIERFTNRQVKKVKKHRKTKKAS